MKRVFADASFWIAIVNPHDQWHAKADEARKALGDSILVTTEEVMSELLAGFSGGGEKLRKAAASMVRTILKNPNVQLLPQTHNSFLDGLEFFENRADKEYSLTDCISMQVMRREKIVEVLTNDHHFEQEQFRILMKS